MPPPRRNKNERRQHPFAKALILTTMMSLVASSHQLSLSTVISALPNAFSQQLFSPRQVYTAKTETALTAAASSVKLAVPSLQLSMADEQEINGTYLARDPCEIPSGFAKMCGKAGGFVPRPLWDDFTNGITPWFESEYGSFIYFSCLDSMWWIDNSSGSPMFLAVTDGNLLLPPTNGWVTLTGRKTGVPRMSFL